MTVTGRGTAADAQRKEGAKGAYQPLPIDPLLPQLLAAVAAHSAAVVVAPPGAGKTTRVPPALLDLAPGGSGAPLQVIVLEPRRVAARAAARRIAAERGWRVGGEVGYQVRFDRVAGPDTRLLIVTEGILVQRLQSDPFLDGVAALVFDEFHERSLDADLALAMARRVQEEVRPDLRLVVMSATLDPGPVAAFLGDCPVVESPGRLHPVDVIYLESRGRSSRETVDRIDPRAVPRDVAAGVERALAATGGDVLAFLPGVGEIERTRALLVPRLAERGIAVLPLYGDLPAEAQDAVLRRSETRRVVLATNVAETSVTVEGVTAVVDSGLARVLRYDPASGLDRLELTTIARASAEQRAGRAGRLAPGLCLRLWTEHEQRALRPREAPEIARVDLARPALQLLAWGERDLDAFRWFEPPDPAALARARELLALLGAVDAGGITPLGRAMARLPVHPRLARLLLEGRRLGRPREVALLAALLSERSPWRRGAAGPPVAPGQPPGRDTVPPGQPGGAVVPGPRPGRFRDTAPPSHRERSVVRERTVVASRSDLLDRLEDLAPSERSATEEAPWGTLDRGAARSVFAVRDRLLELLARSGAAAPPTSPDAARAAATPAPPVDLEEAVGRALVAAYPDRLARRREPNSARAVMVGGRGVRLARESAVTEAELFVCVDLDAGGGGQGAEALVRLASGVEPEWLAADLRSETTEVAFDPARERVMGRRVTRWRDLVLDERETAPPADEAAAALAVAAAQALDRALPLAEPEIAQWLARLRSLAEWMPELGLPRLDPAELRLLLPALCAGRRSFEELRRAPLLDVLRGSLGHRQRAALDREAPERLTVPSGSHLRLHYEEGRPPVLAARIQELFGWAETPRVAAGRVPVLVHLLAPNGRPQQVTADLRSFWATTYQQVRKELTGRYPKHAWPDDPWTAPPERRPRRSR